MIHIEARPWSEMVAHAEASYPDECCGAMIGRKGDVSSVSEAVRLDNAAVGSRRARYEIQPEDLIRAERAARGQGLDLVGIYHSHPDCGAYFSETDLKNSCPWYSFVVLSIRGGSFVEAKSFLPDMEQTKAEEEELTHGQNTDSDAAQAVHGEAE